MTNAERRSFTSYPSPLDQFSSMYKTINRSPLHRDIVFVCGRERLPYHQAVIFQYSSFLSNLALNGSNHGDVVVTLDNVDPVILRMLMDCIYSGKCDKVPAQVLYEVEGILKMLGLNLYFSAEPANSDEVTVVSQQNSPKIEKLQTFVCFECNMSFDLDIKLKIHMKKQHDIKEEVKDTPEEEDTNKSLDVLNSTPLNKSITVPTESLNKTENSLSCTYCPEATSFTSLPQFLQHLSVKHFRKQLREKFDILDFVPQMPCMYCQKPQKNVPSYQVHIGVFHNKVSQFLSKSLREKIRSFNIQRKQERHSKSQSALNGPHEEVKINVTSVKEELLDQLPETKNVGNLKDPLNTDTTEESQPSGLVIKQEIPENNELLDEMNTLNQQIDVLNESVIPNQSSLKSEDTSNTTKTQLNIKQELGSENSQESNIPNDKMMSCTLCHNPKEFPSRANLLQHVSLSHFRNQLADKYITGFTNGQSCDYCKKVQKVKQTYIAHLGVHHEKVLEFIPIEIELQTMIVSQRGRKPGLNKATSKVRKQKITGKKFKSIVKEEKQNYEDIKTNVTADKRREINLKQESKDNVGDERLLDDSENLPPNEQTIESSEVSSEELEGSPSVDSSNVNSDLSQDDISNMSNTDENNSSFGDVSSHIKYSNSIMNECYNYCTICKKPHGSRSQLLQHLSAAHFCSQLTKMYIEQFVFGQNCIYCEKVQKNKKLYALHIGAKHEKVLEFVPSEILERIKNRKGRDYSAKRANEKNALDNSASVENDTDKKSEPGMKCTICKDPSTHSSRIGLLQHASMAHFHKQIAEKYLTQFTVGQNCELCPKKQYRRYNYILHLGAIHKKVIELLPTEMQITIMKCEEKSSNENKPYKRMSKGKKKKNLMLNGPPSLPNGPQVQNLTIQCTLCKPVKGFISKSSFMQHLSISHFRRQIREKYLPNFQSGQPCDECQKSQKSENVYIIHIGTLHQKVIDFIPEEMIKTITDIRRRRRISG